MTKQAFIPEKMEAEVLLKSHKERCEYCNEEIALEGYSCQACCEHEPDADEGYHCLICGKCCAEEFLSSAIDHARVLRKYGDV